MTPALAEVTGRLAADLPQQAALDMLAERFGVTRAVEAYRRVVAELPARHNRNGEADSRELKRTSLRH